MRGSALTLGLGAAALLLLLLQLVTRSSTATAPPITRVVVGLSLTNGDAPSSAAIALPMHRDVAAFSLKIGPSFAPPPSTAAAPPNVFRVVAGLSVKFRAPLALLASRSG